MYLCWVVVDFMFFILNLHKYHNIVLSIQGIVRSPSDRPRAYYTQQGIDPDYQDSKLREPQWV